MKIRIGAYLKKYLGGFFYFIAGAYMYLTKPLDLITVTAIVLCLLTAVLSVTKYRDWSAIGGGMLVSGSIFLQAILSYRCVDCIRAELFILTGVLALALTEPGKQKLTLRILAVGISLFVAGNIAVHYDPKTIIGLSTVVEASQSKACQQGSPKNKIDVITSDNKTITYEIGTKPIVLFSPSCGACIRAVKALAKADPAGERWIAVQAYGDKQKGKELLKENGYTGESYVLAKDWPDMVPVLMTKGDDGKIISVNGQEQMLKIIGKNI